jgi:hypothetical protein
LPHLSGDAMTRASDEAVDLGLRQNKLGSSDSSVHGLVDRIDFEDKELVVTAAVGLMHNLRLLYRGCSTGCG